MKIGRDFNSSRAIRTPNRKSIASKLVQRVLALVSIAWEVRVVCDESRGLISQDLEQTQDLSSVKKIVEAEILIL